MAGAAVVADRDEYWFDEAAADAAVAFFPRYLRFTAGEWAGKPFVLEGWQEHDVIRPAFGWKRKSDNTRRYRKVYVWVPRKNGKALCLKTPIPTPRGWSTMGDLKVGDEVFDDEGSICRVTFATEIMQGRPCYQVTFTDGTSIVADADHQWLAKPKDGTERIVTTAQMAERLHVGSRPSHVERNWTISIGGALDCPDAPLPIHPYALGVWLGDGHKGDARISFGVGKNAVLEAILALGYEMRLVPSSAENPAPSYWLHRAGDQRSDTVSSQLRALGLIGDKHIPAMYLRASLEQRRALLQGLMDTDGHVTKAGQIEIVTVFPKLRDGLLDLVRGLGIKATAAEDRARIGEVDYGPRYRVMFHAYFDSDVVTLEAKRSRLRPRPARPTRNATIKVAAIDKVPTVPVRCIQVDSPSSLYRAGPGMTVTHNTELAAGVAILLLIGDAEPGGQVFSIARDEDQAKLVFDKATAMVQWSPELGRSLTAFKTSIWCQELMAAFKPLTGVAKGKHGLNMSGLVGDELHEWQDSSLYTFVHQSVAARRQPLEFLISTAGKRDTYGWEEWDYCCKIRDGLIDDPETLVVIYAADPDDDWTSPETWRKANPNLGVSVKREYLESECAKARQNPRIENDFKNFHLNLWTQQAVRWLQMEHWDACGFPAPAALGKPHENHRWRDFPEQLRHRRCTGGLDLSSTTDLTALVWCFAPAGEGEPWVLVPRFWMPEDRVEARTAQDRMPYDRWVKIGAILATPGNVIDYAFVKDQIEQDAELFDIGTIGVDPYNAVQLTTELQGDGFDAVFFRQGFLSMSPPAKELERLLLNGRLDHGGHPVLRMCAENVAVTRDPAGNIKPAKDKSTGRIDGIVASVNALGVALSVPDAGPSVYESRGLLELGA